MGTQAAVAQAPWTWAEDEIVQRNYPGHGPSWECWRYVLPGRTPAAIQARASRLGVSASGPRNAPTSGWTNSERRTLLVYLDLARRATGRTAAQCLSEMERMMLWREGALDGR